MKYRFEVQGSAPEPYVVLISRSGDNLTAKCDCAAGSKGQSCKHRLNLFRGSMEGVIGGDIEAISKIPELVSGTDVAEAMNNLEAAENEEKIAKKKVADAKKKLAHSMME